jgi:DNA-binding FadR family transcriptional regulator
MNLRDTDDFFAPVERQSLTDQLVSRIKAIVESGEYATGDRLPAIAEMARGFGVGAPTVRVALTKLEMMRLVEIRHGSGVYVTRISRLTTTPLA